MPMESFQDVPPLWDFSTAIGYPQMQDEEFMNMLSKQFPTTGHGVMVDPLSFGGVFPTGGIDPQNVNKLPLPLPSLTPPSEDSSPSPSNSNQEQDEPEAPAAPKRKATIDDPQEGPSTKTQHTLSNNEKKAMSATSTAAAGTMSTNRRKSTGNVAKDETRLLKRKEQNRAAQRAFRERKEKHVKDLEDRVAELEAKNEEATHENDNLRDLLGRLQSENVMLKQQAQFTFSMPRSGTNQAFPSNDMGAFGSSLASGSNTGFGTPSSSKTPNSLNPLDWSSLNAFDPNKLNLLEDMPQPTATEGAMRLDFGFGNTGLASNAPYTSIASNPMFMSFASSFDSSSTPSSTTADSPIVSNLGNTPSPYSNFDMNSLTAWPPAQSSNQENSLDDLLQGYLSGSNSFNSFLTSPANISPVAHHLKPITPHSISSTSSPSSASTDPLFTPKDTATPSSDDGVVHDPTKCPKSKAELAKRIEEAGQSPFASGVQKCQDELLGTMISCSGSVSFPKTQRSDKNVEVLTAWRSITSNPKFKDTDISELCAEFTAKARCDGHKVVLEPAGVVSILEKLNQKQH